MDRKNFQIVVFKSPKFWHIRPCSAMEIDVSEEHVASTFRVEEEAKQKTNMKHIARKSGIYPRREISS
jgi:hypothetical protein